MTRWFRPQEAVFRISLKEALSKKTELKLTGIARASLGELLLDYEDYLRQRELLQWRKNDPEALRARSALSRADMPDWSTCLTKNLQI